MAGYRRIVWLGVILLVASCSPSVEEATPQQSPGIESELWDLYGNLEGDIRYFEATTDLNGNGKPEVIVHVVSPMLCGTGGCDTLVLTPGPAGYEIVGEISVNRPPIQVSSRSSNGWRNLLVHVSGGGLPEAYEAQLKFDGKAYPSNPTVAPVEPAPGREGAVVVIREFEDLSSGKLLTRQ